MKTVQSIGIETLHRGIVLIVTDTEGGITTLKFSKYEARQLMLRLYRMLGMKGGEGE